MNGDDSFSLNESQLEAILLDDRVKDKPVMVVSVAGTYRQGRSFLLTFFLRFFQNQCQSKWLDNPRILLGGFEWKPGSTRQTTGILLWSLPFLVTTPEGEEVAVLLMDTQGSFDCKSTVKECTTIFALSIMISSVLVYNIFRNIQEDHLQHLQFSSEYGRLAQEVCNLDITVTREPELGAEESSEALHVPGKGLPELAAAGRTGVEAAASSSLSPALQGLPVQGVEKVVDVGKSGRCVSCIHSRNIWAAGGSGSSYQDPLEVEERRQTRDGAHHEALHQDGTDAAGNKGATPIAGSAQSRWCNMVRCHLGQQSMA
ncbi:atlastin-1-like [Amblyomma americanum]